MIALCVDGQPLADEASVAEWQTVELSCMPPDGATLALRVGAQPLEPFLRPGDPTWRWRWAAQGASGAFAVLLRAEWPDGRADELGGSLRVRPRKLDEERYQLLIDDLQQLGRALVFAIIGGREGAARPVEIDRSAPTLAEELAGLFGADLQPFAAAVERIGRRPPERLRSATAQVDLGQARDLSTIDPRAWGVDGDWASPELAAGNEPALPRYSPRRIAQRQAAPTYDSPESRLLKQVLALLWRRLELLLAQPALPTIAQEQGAMARERLRVLRGLPFLVDVGAYSGLAAPMPRMQRDPEYRAVYRMWQQLRRRPLVRWDAATLHIPIGDLARLYERWCAARVALALLQLPGLQLLGQELSAPDPDDAQASWALRLSEGGPLLNLAAANGASLTLRYQARYTAAGRGLRSLDRHTRVPDLALEIRRDDAPPALLVLDAKYRLDATGGVPEDALADAYTYLGSIGTPDGARATWAVALLYPGRGPAESYPSGVAALPLLPGDDTALEAWLAQQLRGILP